MFKCNYYCWKIQLKYTFMLVYKRIKHWCVYLSYHVKKPGKRRVPDVEFCGLFFGIPWGFSPRRHIYNPDNSKNMLNYISNNFLFYIHEKKKNNQMLEKKINKLGYKKKDK